MTAAKKTRKRRESFGAIRKLPSGRHQASYVGPDGERYTAPQTYDSMTDARGWLAQQRVILDSGEWSSFSAAQVAASRKARVDTLDAYANDWMNTRTNRHGEGLRERTKSEYARLLAGPLAELAGKRLVALTPDVVRTWYAAQVESGKRTQAARAYGLLNSILATAVTDGRMKANPCIIRGAQNATTGRKVEPPTASELETMVKTIKPRFKAALDLAAWGALRFGEVTELRRKDLTVLENDGVVEAIVVNVSRAVTHTTGVGFLVGKTKSAAGVRSVVLPPHIFPTITNHLQDFTDPNPEALLFPAADGTSHLAESTFAKSWYPARAAAGRQDMPFHALRHHGATRFAQTGATLREIQDRLGHSTAAAAMRYQHTAGRDAELAKRMSELATQ